MKITRSITLSIILFSIVFFPSSVWAYKIETYEPASFLADPKHTLNLIFVPLGYKKEKKFLTDLEEIVKTLKATEPFPDFVWMIEISTIRVTPKEEQIIFPPKEEFPFINIHQTFMNELKIKFPGKFKLIILNAGTSTSAAKLSSLDKSSAILIGRKQFKNTKLLTKGFLHEFGHSLGLRDESLKAHAKKCPVGPPNCAPSRKEAKKWWGHLAKGNPQVRFYRGCCGSKKYFRPTRRSLMNQYYKAEDYGLVSEHYLRDAFLELEEKHAESWKE